MYTYIYILHYLKDAKLWEIWYIPQYGYCRIYIYIIRRRRPKSNEPKPAKAPRFIKYNLMRTMHQQDDARPQFDPKP